MKKTILLVATVWISMGTFIAGAFVGWEFREASMLRQCTHEIGEYLKEPNGPAWFGKLRIEPVNVERKYFKLEVKQ